MTKDNLLNELHELYGLLTQYDEETSDYATISWEIEQLENKIKELNPE